MLAFGSWGCLPEKGFCPSGAQKSATGKRPSTGSFRRKTKMVSPRRHGGTEENQESHVRALRAQRILGWFLRASVPPWCISPCWLVACLPWARFAGFTKPVFAAPVHGLVSPKKGHARNETKKPDPRHPVSGIRHPVAWGCFAATKAIEMCQLNQHLTFHQRRFGPPLHGVVPLERFARSGSWGCSAEKGGGAMD